MAELNRVSEQKFKRVQKSFENATEMLKKMQTDLWYIHSTIKKLNQLSSADQSAVVNLFETVVSKRIGSNNSNSGVKDWED